MSVIYVRRAGCDGATAQFELQVEIVNDLLRKQADQIRVARQARVVIGKDSLRSRRPTDVIILFQQEHAQAGAPEISRRDKPIVTRTQNHNVIFALGRAHALDRDRLSLADAHGIGFT